MAVRQAGGQKARQSSQAGPPRRPHASRNVAVWLTFMIDLRWQSEAGVGRRRLALSSQQVTAP